MEPIGADVSLWVYCWFVFAELNFMGEFAHRQVKLHLTMIVMIAVSWTTRTVGRPLRFKPHHGDKQQPNDYQTANTNQNMLHVNDGTWTWWLSSIVQRGKHFWRKITFWMARITAPCLHEWSSFDCFHSFGVVSHRLNSKVLPESDAIGVVDAAGLRVAGGCVCVYRHFLSIIFWIPNDKKVDAFIKTLSSFAGKGARLAWRSGAIVGSLYRKRWCLWRSGLVAWVGDVLGPQDATSFFAFPSGPRHGAFMGLTMRCGKRHPTHAAKAWNKE